jgi:DegV family protein with EDD domain
MASRVCILTDSTVQFTSTNFSGQDLVKIIPFKIHLNGKLYHDSRDLTVTDLPQKNSETVYPKLIPPTPEDFLRTYISLEEEFDEIISILVSANLSPSIVNAQEAATSLFGNISVQIIDSKTIGVGLGLLVETSAEALNNGASSRDIYNLLRHQIRHLYNIFCLQSLTYYCHTAHLDPAQALVSELLGISPAIILENGNLVPIQKAHNPRQMVDLLYDFVSEFTDLRKIILIKGVLPFDQRTYHLRERIMRIFPTATYRESTLNASVASLLGPSTLGLVALED